MVHMVDATIAVSKEGLTLCTILWEDLSEEVTITSIIFYLLINRERINSKSSRDFAE